MVDGKLTPEKPEEEKLDKEQPISMKMFKNIPQEEIAASSSVSTKAPGDERLNNEANYEEFAEPITVKTTHTLQDEDAAEAVMELDSILNPEGFASKSFQMTEMLERNQILTTTPITWSSTDTVGTRLHTSVLPRDLTTARFFANKMENFFAIHADMEITCKVNPTPFEQGALLLVLHPQGKNPERIQAYSYYPHELINLPTINHAAIRVPFLAENEAYVKSDTIWEVSVYVMAQLKTATLPTSLEVNVFGRFVNPKLMIPIAQGEIKKNTKNKEVFDQKKDGLVTKITGTVADVLESSGTALRAIPVVGEFIPPLTWAARCANKVASYFGWSKPPNMENANLMIPIPGPRMCHGEGIDNGIPLSVVPDNTCNTTNNSTDIDEMDFAYLFERKFVNHVETFSVGQSIRFVDLNTVSSNTSTNFLTMFSHRRWMRNFEFHMVKTKFHTGRLLVQYDYNNSISTNEEARIAMSTVYSKIVDISAQDSFVFTVPWMDISPFDTGTLGRIVITTFNDIVAAETVAQEFDVIIYNSYRDCQLGLPESTRAFAQGDCCGNTAPIPTDDLIPYKPTSMVEYTMGESVNNLRILSKRFTLSGNYDFTGGTLTLPRNLGGSLFGLINSAYLARAGSIRYKIIIPSNTIATVELRNVYTKTHSIGCHATQVFNSNMNNVIEFAIPFYYPKRRSFLEYPWPDVAITLTDMDGAVKASGKVTVYVAAGDDYNAMFPLGLDVLEEVNNLYSGVTDANDLAWLWGGYLCRDAETQFLTIRSTRTESTIFSHFPGGEGNLFYTPQSTSSGGYYGLTYGIGDFGPVSFDALTATLLTPPTNMVNVNGTSTVTQNLEITCNFSNTKQLIGFAILAGPPVIGIYGRVCNTGSLTSAGTFTSGNHNMYWIAVSASTRGLCYYNSDIKRWQIAQISDSSPHPDYWETGETTTLTSPYTLQQAVSTELSDGTVQPVDSNALIPAGTFKVCWAGTADGFKLGGENAVLFADEDGVGTWCIAKVNSDDQWYQYGVKPFQKRKLIGATKRVEGMNFPEEATSIVRLI